MAGEQISDTVDLHAIVELLQAVISRAGLTRSSGDEISNALAIVRAADER